jgi:hypothetical protein
MYNENEIDQTMAQWMQTKRFTADVKTNALIRQRVEEYLEAGGYVAVSHFERAYLELLNEDDPCRSIQPFRGSLSEQPDAVPAIPADVVAFITSPRTTTSELRRRYSSDPTFRQQFDLYEKTKGQTQQPGVLSLTAAEYHQLPAAQIVQNYRTDHPRGFKAAVDKLIAQGKL